MGMTWKEVAVTAAVAGGMLSQIARAQVSHVQSADTNLISIDATAPVIQPEPVAAKVGASRNPQGHVLGVNSQYLTLDGRPWLPVMGEFHYSRYPEAEWEQEILKMKSAGVQVVATYVIWIHHEQVEGVWDWSGQRDLRKFVQLCGKHGMYVYPRIGPWSHAEVRNGGFPDWVLKSSPVRENNSRYLKEVDRFYAQISMQLKGELWKDGGPVIGIQIENEYREAKPGTGRGSEHIRTLKQMAIADGLDVPLYTVTGWDGAAIPLDTVLPVFGGYPDAPWDGSNKPLYGNEIYAFRFNNRVAGSMGAVGGRGQNAAASYKGTPFLTAEVGAGGEDTYFRRPIFSADDIAAIAPVMLGSGANLLGYYMFHGGTNPDAASRVPTITLEESQRTGGATDVPEKSYDFQAPLGEFGQEGESLRKLKLVHYFLNDFGEELAPMTTRAPAQVPVGPTDTSVARVAARTVGEQGFLFVNNYVRGLEMADRKGFQVELKLPGIEVKVPETPITLPAGAYGIWPVNLPLTKAPMVGTPPILRYSTAQLFKRVQLGDQLYYFFFALPGVVPEFALSKCVMLNSSAAGVEIAKTAWGLRLQTSETAEIQLEGGVHLVVLPELQAEEVWRGDDPAMLLKTKADAFSDRAQWTLQSDDPKMEFGLFGAVTPSVAGSVPLKAGTKAELFARYSATLPTIELNPMIAKVQDAKPRPPWTLGPMLSWRTKPLPVKPAVAEFSGAAAWKITVPPVTADAQVSDVWLKIDYQGDEARLSDGGGLIDDNFWNGLSWAVGLKETLPAWRSASSVLMLRVLPLPRTYPMYLERAAALIFDAGGSADRLTAVRLIPRYQLLLNVEQHQ